MHQKGTLIASRELGIGFSIGRDITDNYVDAYLLAHCALGGEKVDSGYSQWRQFEEFVRHHIINSYGYVDREDTANLDAASFSNIVWIANGEVYRDVYLWPDRQGASQRGLMGSEDYLDFALQAVLSQPGVTADDIRGFHALWLAAGEPRFWREASIEVQ